MFENFSGKPGPSISPVMFGLSPNITGAVEETFLTDLASAPGWSDGAMFWTTAQIINRNTNQGEDSWGKRLNVDASRSSDLYGSSDVVQPASLRALPCIKV